jgi:golgi-specific brefeldin A-resistance guanine nucleotide exchange factor 1
LLEEQVPESLKNCLLVMADGGFLVRPGQKRVGGMEEEAAEEKGEENNEKENERIERIWEETKKRVDRFLPGLFGQIFPEEEQVVEESAKGKEEENASGKNKAKKEPRR